MASEVCAMKIADDAPRALAALGLAVFPVRPGRKEPALRDWQACATIDPQEVTRLFRGRPFNVGVITGARSGGFVLDIDTKTVDGRTTLAELEIRHGVLPETWAVQTPSGGSHHWYSCPMARRIGNRAGFAPGLDIRGEGGFVVAPPSVVNGKAYRWSRHPTNQAIAEAPRWLLDLIAPQRPCPLKAPPVKLSLAGSGCLVRYVTTALVREVEKVEAAAAGRRNQTLFQAAANLGEFVGAGLLRPELVEASLSVAAEASGLMHDDGRHAVANTIASGLRRGMANPRELTP
jgi:hypothetical protein